MISIYELCGFLCGKIAQKISESTEPFLDSYGLTLRQVGTLAVVYEYPSLTQKEIGDIQRIDRTSIGQVLDQLQIAGYISKSHCKTDRKANAIQLTEAGRDCISSLWAEIKLRECQVLSHLSATEQDELLRLMSKVVKGMEDA